MTDPFVSVIVPVRDRRDLLGRLLASLGAQTYPADRFEVVVVDDGSRDGSAPSPAASPPDGPNIRLLRQPPLGAVRARNRGAEAARGEVLAFTDSDCRPTTDWLAEGVRALAGADVVQGVTRADPAMPRRPLDRTVEGGGLSLFDTCNVFYRTDAFRDAGGFDEELGKRFRFPRFPALRGYGFGEDTDLAWRVIRSGGGAASAPRAVVHHHVFPPRAGDLLARTWLVGAFPGLVGRTPELRRTFLRRGVFLHDRRPSFYLALAVALASRRRPALALLTLPYAVRTMRSMPGSAAQRLVALPALVAVDLVATVALAVGALADRRLVL